MIDLGGFPTLFRSHLPRQRWYSGSEAPEGVTWLHSEVRGGAWPLMLRGIVDADGALYQVVCGLRPAEEEPEFLRGRDEAVIGVVPTALGPALAYDAVHDSHLGLGLLDALGDSAVRCRPMGFEQSNSSLVYDERVILKLYRRLHPGRNRDVEMTEALAAGGFDHVARPLAVDQLDLGAAGPFDLAVLQPFLTGGVDAWALALTSLRDLFGTFDTQQVPVIDDFTLPPEPVGPSGVGGDFAAEARRLGAITAEMHLKLAEAFGPSVADPRGWAGAIEDQLRAAVEAGFDVGSGAPVVDRLRQLDEAGMAIRTHGDLHLGQALRTDTGWFMLDFEGEPDRTPEERSQPTSALRDVAGMLRSFHYASRVALSGREEAEEMADAWETRNRWAFFDGYSQVAGPGGLLPPNPSAVSTVLAAFELEKALYELAYEASHRPEWQHIPRAALARMGMGSS